MHQNLPRRQFIQYASLASLGALTPGFGSSKSLDVVTSQPLRAFGYGEVTLADGLHEQQRQATHTLLMTLSEDSLLKPLRQMSGQAAPGADLGGWYHYDPHYDTSLPLHEGYAPAATFGQWVSALARNYAITRDPLVREKVQRLNRLYAQTITAEFYEKNRFPAYCYDKFVCGLIDSEHWAGDSGALAILEHTTNTALPHLPPRAVEMGEVWRADKDESTGSDESYTIAENLLLAYERGAGARYRALGRRYLFDEFFDLLAAGEPALTGRHAYSHINALSSAMQAYLVLGSHRHLRAAANGFDMLAAQSFATGGWGPNETLLAPHSGDLAASLSDSHSSFETPCGAYAHFKLTRYLLQATRAARYGDSMERVMINTVLGAKPTLADGSTFYYADYNFRGRKEYSDRRWPCCSGTLPQVAADYRINIYFRAPHGVYVNLYLPSTLRWTQDGARLSLTQCSGYPFDGNVQLTISTSKTVDLALCLRIPGWAEGASILVNGARQAGATVPGQFAVIQRHWQSGDRIELELPMKLRLEPIDAQHLGTVALLYGPLVLFAIGDAPPHVTAQQLLASKRTGEQCWQAQTSDGPLTLLPFTAIAGQSYSTYLPIA